MSNKHNRTTVAANQASENVHCAEEAVARINGQSIAKVWPPAIPVSEEPEEGKPLMVWYDGAWHEAIFTEFYSPGKPEWRTHPANAGISPTHYHQMPPAPEVT